MKTERITLERTVPIDDRWRAEFKMCRTGCWCPVVNEAGEPIAYDTESAACDAAKRNGAAWRLAGPPRL